MEPPPKAFRLANSKALEWSTTPGNGQFCMIYSMTDLMCHKIIQILKIKSPDQFADETFENAEFQVQKSSWTRNFVPGSVDTKHL